MMKRISTLLLSGLIVVCAAASAQLQTQQPSPLGTWEGPLVLGRDNMNIAFTISLDEGNYKATFFSAGLGIYGLPAEEIKFSGFNFTITLERLNADFSGTFRPNEKGDKYIRVDGDWFQDSELVPVVLLPVESASF